MRDDWSVLTWHDLTWQKWKSYLTFSLPKSLHRMFWILQRIVSKRRKVQRTRGCTKSLNSSSMTANNQMEKHLCLRHILSKERKGGGGFFLSSIFNRQLFNTVSSRVSVYAGSWFFTTSVLALSYFLFVSPSIGPGRIRFAGTVFAPVLPAGCAGNFLIIWPYSQSCCRALTHWEFRSLRVYKQRP